ncbi:hypothetical protein [Pseudovibrio denitrificans]|nr:hypothetical protein [Pseudovibrio denitrificans]
MSTFSNAFGALQKVGKALMLPVSVLPAAGILLASALLTCRSFRNSSTI